MGATAANTYIAGMTLAERVCGILKEMKMTKQELALRIQYSRSAVSQYLGGKYSSDPTELEAALMGFVEEYEAENGKQGAHGKPEGSPIQLAGRKAAAEYFESQDYVQTIGVCSSCQRDAALGIIVAKSGFGKTHALKKYATMPRVAYIEGNETMNCKDIVRRLENRIGMARSYGSIDERMERIIEFFNVNQGYLIIMDEADKLINKYTQKKIELLRNITDAADVGLVVAGEPALEGLLKCYDARFTNRMDFCYRLRGLTEQEVRGYLSGYDIEDAAMAEFMRRARNTKTGCFRLLARTLRNVLRIMEGSGQERITMKAVGQASDMMLL